MIPDAAVNDEGVNMTEDEFQTAILAAKAEAWEEGAEAGSSNQCAWDGWRYSKGYPITNPYRKAAK